MEWALSSGLMVAAMRVSGVMIRPTDRENLFTLMAISMKANGSMTKLKAWEHILMQMVLTTKDNGLTISSMVMVWNHGLTALAMKESTKMARKKVKAG